MRPAKQRQRKLGSLKKALKALKLQQYQLYAHNLILPDDAFLGVSWLCVA